ncbi:MAG TPA: UvrD-helicase domain-containing protein [Nocardioidaceae bacterium]|nr:UvrD-helicase domain-containing protein [Nocardioidaceae bacterium]
MSTQDLSDIFPALAVRQPPGGDDEVHMTQGERLLEGLDPEQREVATSLGGPVCVLAGAGTGKTRAITHRIAYAAHTGAVDPTRVLAVTFTTRAAGEMRGRLGALGVPNVQARTFHSAALRQARYFWPKVYGGPLPEVVKSKFGLMGEAAARCRLRDARTEDLKDFAAEVEWAKVSNVRPDDYAVLAGKAGRRLAAHDPETVARVFAAYEEVKRLRDRIDMEDVLLCAAALLAEDDRVAAAVRRQYAWFVVDEFQDVNAIQRALLDLWLGDRDQVCVVGDPAQTIYSFTGASPDHLLGFTRHYPDATVVRLTRNYRSTPQIIETANRLLHGSQDRVVLQAQRPGGADVLLSERADEVDEAEWVADQVVQARARGTALSDMAVLFRINAQSQPFEEALAARSVPYAVRGAERFFERPEVRQAVTLLRGAARSGDTSGDGLVDDVTAVLGGQGWTPDRPTGGGARAARWESLDALRALGAAFARDRPDADLNAFVDDLDHRAARQHAPVADGVTLASMHSAKGLEWPVLFVTGAHEGSVPFVRASTPAQVEEERRLLYVAATRARDRLAVSWSLARSPGGRATRDASRFLDGVRPGDAAARSAAGARRSRRGKAAKVAKVAHCRVCERALHDAAERKTGRCADCPPTYDEALFARLREWRTEQAQREKVPAYVVFTDATLTAIAETRPTDATALVRIAGIGRVKIDKYADAVLRICEEP